MEEKKIKRIVLKPYEVPPMIRKQFAKILKKSGDPVEMAYEDFYTTTLEEDGDE